MKNTLGLLLAILCSCVILSCTKTGTDENQDAIDSTQTDTASQLDTNTYYQLVEISTDWGKMLFWLYDETPLHKTHFIQMVEDSFFNDQIFNRIVRNFVIQGGCPDTSATGINHYPVQPEFDSCVQHIYGAIGMGRYGDDVNPEKLSNGCQIYIVSDTTGEHQLDMNYTIFGIMIDGNTTLSELNKIPTKFNSDEPRDDIISMHIDFKSLSADSLAKLLNIETSNLDQNEILHPSNCNS